MVGLSQVGNIAAISFNCRQDWVLDLNTGFKQSGLKIHEKEESRKALWEARTQMSSVAWNVLHPFGLEERDVEIPLLGGGLVTLHE